MSDEKISQMPDVGPLTGSERFAIILPGIQDNYSTSSNAIAAFLDTRSGGGLTVSNKQFDHYVMAAEDGTYFDTGGAAGSVNFFLPSWSPGLSYGFLVGALFPVAVVAESGQFIAFGFANSVAGGSVQSTVPFSFIGIYAPEGVPGQWVAHMLVGAWEAA